MIIWEEGEKHVISENCVTALKALQVGYRYIRGIHGAVLGTYGLCYAATGGYIITEEGRSALQVWGEGYDYDQGREDRKHPSAPSREAGAASSAG